MSRENQHFDRKSLRYTLSGARDGDALAGDCVGFANARGGVIHVGVEDSATDPPGEQRLEPDYAEKLRKRLDQLTVNVALDCHARTAPNGGEYVEIKVFRTESGVASTSDGRYFLRVADETQPVLPDGLDRLWSDRGSFVWELRPVPRSPLSRVDSDKLASFTAAIRQSERVSPFVRNKSDDELLRHYFLAKDGLLTQLGVLWVGRREDRAALAHAPVVQCLKFDEAGRKVQKWVWADYALNPLELIEAIWQEVPDWRESYEFPAGLFRRTVAHYDQAVVRELLVNALIHRPYTMRGDIFVNLHPDRMEVHNPGLLPIGVTPANILHVSVQRNPHLARVAYDLGMMESEGSGFDRIYEALLSTGRPVPVVAEGDDRVVVTVRKQVARPEVLEFMSRVEREFQPSQKEIIALGLIAQAESVTALQLAAMLDLESADWLRPWLDRPREWGLVRTRGRTKGTEYQIEPSVLKRVGYRGPTSLKRIEFPRLRELILEDLRLHGWSARAEIHGRIGPEIPVARLRRALAEMSSEGLIEPQGVKRWRRYRIAQTAPKNPARSLI